MMVKCTRWWSVQVSSEAWLYFTLLLAVKMGSSVCPVGDQLLESDVVHAFQKVGGVGVTGVVEVEVVEVS